MPVTIVRAIYALPYIAAGFGFGAVVAHLFGLGDDWFAFGAASATLLTFWIGRDIWRTRRTY